jgi:hypothetical protein
MADYTIAAADPRWKRFEKLGARMLATLSPNAHVVYNDSIRGKLSQADRQIDVSIRSQRDGAEHLAIVQCRDYKQPLDVNAVGEFDSVIRDVGAASGIMISVHGWTQGAKTYARALNIDLLRLVDAENKIWAEYFGDAPAAFQQVVTAPTLVTHRSLEISFSFHTSRIKSSQFRMPYDFHDGALVHEDGRSAGTPLNLVGMIWADEAIPHEPGEALLVVDLTRPVFFEIDESRTPICRIMFHARVIETHRFGMWQLTTIEGLANELDGSILSRGFTTSPFDIEDVLKNWQDVASPEACPSRPTMRIVTAGAWDVDESVEPPHIATLRSVSPQEFQTTDAICP